MSSKKPFFQEGFEFYADVNGSDEVKGWRVHEDVLEMVSKRQVCNVLSAV